MIRAALQVSGRALLVLAAWLAFLLAIWPLAALALLGARGLPEALAGPGLMAAFVSGLVLAAFSALVSLPLAALAALGLWEAGPKLRRTLLAAAILTLLLPPALVARGAAGGLQGSCVALLAAHAAPCACLALLILTLFLDRLPPPVLRGALLCGASPLRAAVEVLLPALHGPLLIAAAASFTLSLGQMDIDAALARPGHPTLAGLLHDALSRGDAGAASPTLLLSLTALASLVLVFLLALAPHALASAGRQRG